MITAHVAFTDCDEIKVQKPNYKTEEIVIRGTDGEALISVYFPPEALPALREAVRILEDQEAQKTEEMLI